MALLATGLAPAASAASPPSNAYRYVYDPDGHLRAVVVPAGETALYSWDPAGNLLSVGRQPTGALSVIQVAPAEAAIGETVTIYGTGFSTNTASDAVQFNGTSAVVGAATETTLSVAVPAGATSGTVTVQTAEGPASSPQPFTVGTGGAPLISTFAPARAAAESLVTVTGANFDPQAIDDVVTLNHSRVDLTSASATSLAFKVPTATLGGHVSVSTPQGSTQGGDLYVAPQGVAPSSIGATVTTALGKTVGVTFAKPKKVALALFDGTQGQRVSLTIPEATVAEGDVTLLGPEDADLSSTNFNANVGFLEPVALPTTGTYTILLEPVGEDIGKVKLAAYSVVDLTGALSPTAGGATTAVSLKTPGQRGLYTIAGRAGQSVSLKVSKAKLQGTYSLEWLSPEGQAIASENFSGETGFMSQVRFPAAGTYTLVVNPYGHTGSLTLTAYEASDVTGTVTPTPTGGTQSVSISVPGQYARIGFSGSAGQRVSLRLTESSIPSGTASVWTNEGAELGSVGFFGGSAAFLEPIALPTTGAYTILIEPSGAGTGKVKLSAYSVTDVSGSIAPTASGAPTPVSITTPGQRAVYSVAVTAGEAVSVRLTKAKLPSSYYLEWQNAEGQAIASESFSGATGFMGQTKFPTAGTYKLLVVPYGGGTGSVTLTAYDASDVTGTIAPAAEGAKQQLSIGVPGQYARLSFDGTEGQRVSLLLAEATIGYGYATLLGPEGSYLASTSFSAGGEALIEPVTLPASGKYTVLIEPSGEDTGEVTLAAYLVTDVTGSLTPTFKGTTTAVSIKTPGQRALYTIAGTAGHAVSVKLAKATFPSTYSLEWLNPKGQGITGQDFGGEAGFMEQVKFPAWGSYTLVVNPFGHTGAVTLTAYNASDVTGTLTPTTAGESKTLTIGVPGQHARISFAGTAGQTVTLKASGSTIASGWMSVWDPEGNRVNGSEASFSGAGAAVEVTPETTGAYAILLEPSGEDTGKVTLTGYLGSHPSLAQALASAKTASALARPAPEGAGGTSGFSPILPAVPTPPHGAPRANAPHANIVARANRALSAPTVRSEASSQPRPSGVKASGYGVTAAMRAFRPVADRRATGGAVGASPQPLTPWTKAPRLLALYGATGLSGQVLAQSGIPVAGVRVSIEDTSIAATTDEAGRFLLTGGVPAGHDVVVVDGEATGSRTRYGSYQFGVDVPRGRTTILPYTIWLTPLEAAGEHHIGSPASRELRLRNPRIPGLEVRLPAGTVITDERGKPVTDVNLTAIPVDRPPFPLPPFVQVPLYFTVQPGGAYLSKGAQIVYPNWAHLPPGQRVPFWNYDPDKRGWYVYGEGTVTPNGRQVVPDPDVRIWEFSGAMISGSPTPPSSGPKPGVSAQSGEPVDLGTGLFVQSARDLVLPDTLPIVIERTYRQADPTSYSFGVGTTSPYDIRLWSTNNYQETDLVLPDGGRVHYTRISPGAGFTEAVYEAKTTPGIYYGSTIRWNQTGPPGWSLTLTDGLTYVFGEVAPLQAIHDRYGNQLTLTREDGQTGNITKITSPHGRWVKLSYDTGGRITEVTDDGGRHIKYAYTNGFLTSVTDAADAVTKYEYDEAGDMTSVTDARGIKYLTNEYDANDRVAKQTMGDGGTYSFSYALNGSGGVERTTVTEPLGSKRQVSFNEEGFPTRETVGVGTPEEQTTTIEPQPGSGLPLAITDPRKRKTEWKYDAYGNVIQQTRLAGTAEAQTTTATYEPGTTNATKTTDALGHSTTMAYGSHGELLERTDAAGHSDAFSYDGEGNLLSVTDALGHTTKFGYTFGDLTSVTDPTGRTSTQFLDALGRVAATRAPDGSRTTYSFDPDNHVTSMRTPSGATTTMQYNADGEPASLTDPRKDRTTMAYDAMDRLERETDPLGHAWTVAYNAAGLPAETVDPRGATAKLSYDALGRIKTAAYGFGAKTGSIVTYSYDNANRLTKAVDSASGTYSLAYDELDRLTKEQGPTGTVSYTYDAAGRRKTMDVAGQEPVEYTFDEANRLTRLASGGQTVSIGYDAADDVTQVTLPDGLVQTYAYDEAGRPTAIVFSKGGATIGEIDSAYDLDGRQEATWGSYARIEQPETLTGTSYNAANELTQRNGKTLTYDAAGDLVSDGTNEYRWDARSQLASIAGGVTAAFGYDAFGRRISKTLAGSTTKVLFDGANAVQETTGSTTTSLLTGLEPDQLYARTAGGSTESYLTDARGSTVALADGSGTPVTTYSYDAFGTATAAGAASANPYQYTGRENDGDGLQYNRARYYAPASGRFVSQDPARGAGSGVNLYEYAGDDPLDFADPSGLSRANGAHLAPGPPVQDPAQPSPLQDINRYVQDAIKCWDDQLQYALSVFKDVGPFPETDDPSGPIALWKNQSLANRTLKSKECKFE